jgi:TetR/AcrR family tetracycline transcriptional repressor
VKSATARNEVAAPRRPLNRERVVDAALDLADRDGLEALTMRRLAGDLGVDPMAIYNHVDGKDALLDALAARLWSEVQIADGDGRWDDQLRDLARSVRRMFQRHPRTAPLALTRAALPLPTVASFHHALEILRARGLPEEIAAAVTRSLISYASGYGFAELTCLGTPGRRPGETAPDPTDVLLALGRALPADTPRELVDAAVSVLDCDTDACFEFGLDLLIAGADRHRTKRK